MIRADQKRKLEGCSAALLLDALDKGKPTAVTDK